MPARGKVAATLGVALAVLAGAAGARADSNLGSANGLTYIEDSVTLAAAPSENTFEAACPENTYATGGGATFSPGLDSGDVYVNSTRPIDLPEDADSDPDDGWRNRLVKEGGTTSTGSVTAICADEKPLYVKSSVRTRPKAAADVVVRCPAGTSVAGGGGQVSGAMLKAHLHTSAPFDGGDAGSTPDDGWRVRAYNSSGKTKRVTAHVTCWTRITQYETVTTEGVFAFPECQGSGSASGGGIKSTGPADGARIWITDPFASPENPPDDGFTTALHSLVGSKAHTGYAICSSH